MVMMYRGVLYDTPEVRSLADIAKIEELEKERAVRDLRQQAMVLRFALENITNPDLLYSRLSVLNSRLKALKEQG